MKHKDRNTCTRIITPSRRRFLQGCLGAGVALASPALFAARHPVSERSLALKNLHTGEALRATFWADGQYIKDELNAVAQVLRDHRSGDVHRMDPKLLDILFALQHSVGVSGSFHVISGYRSLASNEKLRTSSNGVAKRSFHTQGKAVDIRLPGCKLSQLRQAALDLQAGGVGYYPKSDFIHIDTGNVRRW